MTERCADCGRELELHRGRWAAVEQHYAATVYSYACDAQVVDGQVLSARYHHLEGEPQVVFTPEDSGHVPVDPPALAWLDAT